MTASVRQLGDWFRHMGVDGSTCLAWAIQGTCRAQPLNHTQECPPRSARSPSRYPREANGVPGFGGMLVSCDWATYLSCDVLETAIDCIEARWTSIVR